MTSTRWQLPKKVDIPSDLLALCGGSELVASLLIRRGIQTAADAQPFLKPAFYIPSSPYELPQMDIAVERIRRALEEGETICVWGDFDVDGQTSTALLVSALRHLGGQVRYHIPIRAVESHGIKLPALEVEIRRGVDLLLTCDTGVSAHEAVDYAVARGVDVVITDHHDLPETLPAALAVLNPKRLPPAHPLRELPGVGCAYKLVEALFEGHENVDWLASTLDLVALGIVADVAVLRGDARYLVQRGLEVLRQTTREGLRQLYLKAKITNPALVTETTIGFTIAPRMNALGRLSDANAAVEFLTTSSAARAQELAEQLELLNAKRRMLVEHVFSAVQARLKTEPGLLDHAVLVVEGEGWPGGVIGIVASRLVEAYDRPVVLLTLDEQGMARGSARSVDGVDISAALRKLDDLLTEYGGHPMAAGMAFPSDQIQRFRSLLGRAVKEQIGEETLVRTLNVDARIVWSSLSLELADALNKMAPFGAGNSRPVFISVGLQVVESHILGKDHRHRKLIVSDQGGAMQEVLWWNGSGEPLPEGAIDLAYHLVVNTYHGQRRVQLEWVDARPSMDAVVATHRLRKLEILDHRDVDSPFNVLSAYSSEGMLVWVEGDSARIVKGKRRHQLAPAESLAIWTVPPSLDVLQAAVRKVKPGTLMLFAQNAGWRDAAELLKLLAGVAKHALIHVDGRIDLERAAGACAATERAVTIGLRVLAAQGDITIKESSPQVWSIAAEGEESEEASSLFEMLKEQVAEIQAYRDFYRNETSEALLSDL